MNRNDYIADIGVLFIIFNRIDTAKKVFEAIKKAKIPRLYLASDGPRTGKNEKDIIYKIRKYVLDNITWECEVHTLFREKNLTCGTSVKEAIDWFFKYEKYGIILEDDTLPRDSFFRYCEELLQMYENDDRVGMISGNNFVGGSFTKDSYLFSKFKNTWGWATWRRAWVKMDFEMNWQKTIYADSIIHNMGYKANSIRGWKHNLFAIKNNLVSSWDYQWSFALASQNQLSIVPIVNLVSNIGFGANATHTRGKGKQEYLNSEDINFPLVHPNYILPIVEYEQEYEKFMYRHHSLFWLLKFKLRNFIK